MEPNVSQVVKFEMRIPATLETGEYRSHILFRAIAEPSGTDNNAGAPTGASGISVQIAPIYGISVPLIARHGKTSATVGMNNLSLSTAADGVQVISGNLSRGGNESAYGDIQLLYTPNGGASISIGNLGGVAIYSPNSDRTFSIRVAMPTGMKLQGGSVKVRYRKPAADGGKTIVEGNLAVS